MQNQGADVLSSAPQTVDKPLQTKLVLQGGSVKGDGESPFTYNPCKNGNFFGSSHFCPSSCRHFVDSLRGRCSLIGPCDFAWLCILILFFNKMLHFIEKASRESALPVLRRKAQNTSHTVFPHLRCDKTLFKAFYGRLV